MAKLTEKHYLVVLIVPLCVYGGLLYQLMFVTAENEA